MKTFTAKEFEIEFYKAMHEWLQGGKVGPDPRGQWECASENTANSWVQHMVTPRFLDDKTLYRWKPAKKRTVVIDGVELVAPEVNALEYGNAYFAEGFGGLVDELFWCDDTDPMALANGKVFLTREDCQAMADAQRKQRMGGAS